MNIPDDVRSGLRERVWALADEISWSELADTERAKCYERWTKAPDIGGRLAHYMDPRKVRVYIKDSLLKPYERERLSRTESQILRHLGVPSMEVTESYIKPHGRLFTDGRVVCWGKGRDWKLILLAAFERAFRAQGGKAYAVVLMEGGRPATSAVKSIVADAAGRLGIERIEWIN